MLHHWCYHFLHYRKCVLVGILDSPLTNYDPHALPNPARGSVLAVTHSVQFQTCYASSLYFLLKKEYNNCEHLLKLFLGHVK